ncbi:hypothetical protein PR048_010874 [Dryococelus australis]|uniref:THAP-type domain-containing protein n=1 Tax=Dryococelus australis TaxID=614101 RepID=A0ABQ9I3X4_9NEOP|nr:hypothetical protein PR048_010874 [Dryococelus australis]
MYHRFPNDLVTPKNWIFACKRKNVFKADTSRVCSIHFSENDYERDLQSELTGMNLGKYDLVHDLLLPNKCGKEKDIQKILNAKKTKIIRLIKQFVNQVPSQDIRVILKIHFLEHEIKLFQVRVLSLEEEIKRKKNASLRQELINIKIQHRQCSKYVNTKLREVLKDVFMPKQIERLILKNKKRIRWEDHDIAAAVTLHSISRKAYLYLRKNVGLPLPGLSTI